MIQVTSHLPTLDEAVVTAFEEEHGTIPSRFRTFLLEHNGGLPVPDEFEFTERDGCRTDGCLAQFLGIGKGTSGLEWKLEVFADRIPRDLFPIASTPGGDLVLLARDDSPRAGAVFYWRHEEEADEGEVADDRNIYPIADTFEAFLASLHD